MRPGSHLVLRPCLLLLFVTSCIQLTQASCDFDPSLTSEFKDGHLHYVIYNDNVSFADARCLCLSCPDTRLAIFDDTIGASRDEVDKHLTKQGTSEDFQFWVDAKRDNDGSIYTWANNRTLPNREDLWGDKEPEKVDRYVKLRWEQGKGWKYFGWQCATGPFKPLCQSGWDNCAFNQSLASWFKSGDLFYIIYNVNVTIRQARCLCSSLPDSRLAVFDENISRAEVDACLTANHPGDQFWVDAERQDGVSDYVWSNNCTLRIGTDFWYNVDEPAKEERYARLQRKHGEWKFLGITDSVCDTHRHYKPLCQSRRAPFYDYLPSPPALTWVRLGNVGHLFGFSRETRNLKGAKEACRHQAGTVFLATLDHLYDEVAKHVKDNYPDRAFWLDAVVQPKYENSTECSFTYAWPTGEAYGTATEGIGLMLVTSSEENQTLMVYSPVQVPAHFICEGFSATETVSSSADFDVRWEVVQNLAGDQMTFGFSNNMLSFPDARDACAAQGGGVRLAILDILFQEVGNWVNNAHPGRDYWVDVSRPESAESTPFLWGDGQNVDSEVWKDGYLQVGLVGVLRSSGKYLDSSADYLEKHYFICMKEQVVTLDWVLLGSPGEMFGFSRTPSFGQDWARRACQRQAGNVTLANLDTHFVDVKQYMINNLNGPHYWVDATSSSEGTSFMWGNGMAVNDSMWQNSIHSGSKKAAKMSTTGLHPFSRDTDRNDFICQGNPTVLVIPPKLQGCQEEDTTTENPTKYTTTDYPNTTTDYPNTTMDYPNTTTDYPNTTTDYPNTTMDYPNTTTDYPNTTVDCMRECGCTAPKPKNLTAEQVQELVKNTKKELEVDKSKLSATRRRKTSAPDDRTSAKAAGFVGILVIVLTIGIIVVPDLINFVRFLRKKFRRRKKNKRATPSTMESAVLSGRSDSVMSRARHEAEDTGETSTKV